MMMIINNDDDLMMMIIDSDDLVIIIFLNYIYNLIISSFMMILHIIIFNESHNTLIHCFFLIKGTSTFDYKKIMIENELFFFYSEFKLILSIFFIPFQH